MIDKNLIPSAATLASLAPQTAKLPDGRPLYLFHSTSVDILKLDFVFPAGSAAQDKPLCAGVARDMMLEASATHNATEVAQLFDRLGVVIDRDMSAWTTKLTVYVLKKHAPQVYPLLRDLLLSPSFGTNEFKILIAKRRQMLLTNACKTSYVARNAFYEALYGPLHPEGRHALPGDEANLTLDDIQGFANRYFKLGDSQLILAGNYDNSVLELICECFGREPVARPYTTDGTPAPPIVSSALHRQHTTIPSCVQTTLRVGRLLPFDSLSMDYAYFMILNTVLGGYFGSRLMTNIREEKGYTYGITAMTRIVRHGLVFAIVSDVANEVVQPALDEIHKEIDILRTQPVPDDEIALVCNYMAGDFLRSIDGIFERSERFYNMFDTLIDERLATNYFEALDTVTPEKIMELSNRLFDSQDIYVVTAGY